jgi:hypothetical protein
MKTTLPPICRRSFGTAAFLGLLGLCTGSLLLSPPLAAQTPAAKANKETPAAENGSPQKKAKEPARSKAKTPLPRPALPPVEDRLLPNVSGAEQVAYINEQFAKLWQDNKIVPSERCSDYEFIRRASLDLIGRIATVDEIQRFFKDPPQERRARLIERLLASDEYAQNFANIWTTLLLTRSAGRVYQQQMQLWLSEQFQKTDANWSKIVTDLLTASGKSDDNGAVNFILAHLGEENKENPKEEGRYQMVPITSRSMRLFLGLRIQCTQCHDHPFNDEWKQSHFWGVNAFFRQVDAPLGRPGVMMKKDTTRNRLELVDNPNLNPNGIVSYERRNGVVLFTKPVFLDGRKYDPASKLTRRQQLAQFVVTSPYFAKAFVNRMWGHFFGRGLYTTSREVDDFGEHNPIVLPELLDKLAEDWATRYQYNPRDLIRWICNSRLYGLSSVANATNTSSDAEPFFSRMLLKAMSPEQLFESLMVATQSKAAANDQMRRKMREEWLNKLILNFGDDEGNEANFNGTVVQALMLMNGEEINKAITDREYGTVAHVLKQRGITRDSIAYLFLAALNRPPTEAEYRRLLVPQMRMLLGVRSPRTPQETVESYVAFYQDLFWAILNSSEFFLNH